MKSADDSDGIRLPSHDLLGEIGCVTEPVSLGKQGIVRILGRTYFAVSRETVKRGQWVRVTDLGEDVLDVLPLNVWLGSCCL